MSKDPYRGIAGVGLSLLALCVLAPFFAAPASAATEADAILCAQEIGTQCPSDGLVCMVEPWECGETILCAFEAELECSGQKPPEDPPCMSKLQTCEGPIVCALGVGVECPVQESPKDQCAFEPSFCDGAIFCAYGTCEPAQDSQVPAPSIALPSGLGGPTSGGLRRRNFTRSHRGKPKPHKQRSRSRIGQAGEHRSDQRP